MPLTKKLELVIKEILANKKKLLFLLGTAIALTIIVIALLDRPNYNEKTLSIAQDIINFNEAITNIYYHRGNEYMIFDDDLKKIKKNLLAINKPPQKMKQRYDILTQAYSMSENLFVQLMSYKEDNSTKFGKKVTQAREAIDNKLKEIPDFQKLNGYIQVVDIDQNFTMPPIEISGSKSSKSNRGRTERNPLVLVEQKGEVQGDTMTSKAVVKNTGKAWAYLSVNINYLDSNGKVVDTQSKTIRDIKANESRNVEFKRKYDTTIKSFQIEFPDIEWTS